MRKFLIGIFYVLLFLALIFAPFVQGAIILGHITGTVTDADTGSPIAGATVTVTIGSSVNEAVITSASGYYDISGLNGNFSGVVYNVTAQKTGYFSSTAFVTMVSSIDFVISVSQNFTLTPNATTTHAPTPTPTIPELPVSVAWTAILLTSGLLLVGFKKSRSLFNF